MARDDKEHERRFKLRTLFKTQQHGSKRPATQNTATSSLATSNVTAPSENEQDILKGQLLETPAVESSPARKPPSERMANPAWSIQTEQPRAPATEASLTATQSQTSGLSPTLEQSTAPANTEHSPTKNLSTPDDKARADLSPVPPITDSPFLNTHKVKQIPTNLHLQQPLLIRR